MLAHASVPVANHIVVQEKLSRKREKINLGKYHATDNDNIKRWNADLLMYEAIANELAEANRLKRLELRYKFQDQLPKENEYADWQGEYVEE